MYKVASPNKISNESYNIRTRLVVTLRKYDGLEVARIYNFIRMDIATYIVLEHTSLYFFQRKITISEMHISCFH